MAEDVKQEMNTTPGCIPSKWTRNTVADGDWLQKYTIGPLSSRDNFLADKISGAEFNIDEEIEARKAGDAYLSANLTGFSAEYFEFKDNVETSAENLSAALQAEIITRGEQDEYLYNMIISETATRQNEDIKLQKQIDKLEAATDVIMVYGDYNAFTTNSGELFLTDADVIKVLYDETSGSEQVYYQWYDPASGHEWSGWSGIGSLEPYYSIADVDRIISDTKTELSSVVSNNYLSAKGAVLTGRNIVITEDPNNPKITIATKDVVDFDKVSATTAYGSSAKFDNISSTSLTALTATGNSAEFGYFSGTNIRGGSNTATIDALISSAQNGKDAYDKVSAAYWSAYKDSTHSGSGKLSANFSISAGENLDMDISDNIIKLNGKPAGVIHDDNLSGLGVQGDLLGLNSAVNVYVPAVQDQNFSANVQIGYTPNNLPFDGLYQRDYVGVALNRNYGLNNDIGFQLDELGLHLNSIYSPDQSTITSYSSHFTMYEYFALNSAYWNIRFKNITAFDVNGTEKPIRLSELKLSAGQGLSFKMSDYSDWSGPALWVPPGVTVPNTSGYRNLTLSINDSIITSADHGQVAYETLGSAKISANSSPAFTGLLSNGFRISAGNNLIITTTSNNTIQLNAKPTGLTSISAGGNGNVNKNYTDNLSLSATSPVKFVTAAGNVLGVGVESATLQAGQGISFYKAGTNILGISADAQSPEPGRCIEIGADNSINLSSTISADNIIMSGVVVSTNVSAYYSPSGIHLLRAGTPGPEVYLTPSEVSSIVPDGHMGSITSTISWDAIINSHYVSAATPPLTFSSAPPNIVPSEMIDNVIYLI